MKTRAALQLVRPDPPRSDSIRFDLQRPQSLAAICSRSGRLELEFELHGPSRSAVSRDFRRNQPNSERQEHQISSTQRRRIDQQLQLVRRSPKIKSDWSQKSTRDECMSAASRPGHFRSAGADPL